MDAVPTALRGGRCRPCLRAAAVLQCCYCMQSGEPLPADCDELHFLLPELLFSGLNRRSLLVVRRPVAVVAALTLSLVALRRLGARLWLWLRLRLGLMNLGLVHLRRR